LIRLFLRALKIGGLLIVDVIAAGVQPRAP
jgi:hypothetical protein